MKAGFAAGFVACAAAGAIGAYAGNLEGAVGLPGASLMGIVWGILLAQVATEGPGRDAKPPHRIAFSAYSTILACLVVPLVVFAASVALDGTFALWLGLAAVAPAPLGGYCLASLAINYPRSRARRIIAPELLFRDHPRR